MLVYVEAFRDDADLQRENFAWLIASVANIAGAKPKVTVDKLLKRKVSKLEPVENMRQNGIAAGLLAAIAKAPPKPPGQLAPAKARSSGEDLERMREQAVKPRGAVIATARVGDAPVSPDVAKAKLEAFRGTMRALQGQIDERKVRGDTGGAR